MNGIAFLFEKGIPKSLGIEQIEPDILSKIDQSKFSVGDMMATAGEHIATQISNTLIASKKRR